MNIKTEIARKKAIMEMEKNTPEVISGGITCSYVGKSYDGSFRSGFEATSRLSRTIGSGSSYVSDRTMNKHKR